MSDTARHCAACRVQQGECPNCGTFWIIHGTKRYGVIPTDRQFFRAGSTEALFPLNARPNVLTRTAS